MQIHTETPSLAGSPAGSLRQNDSLGVRVKKQAKRVLRGQWRKLRHAYVQRLYAFGPAELRAMLVQLGLAAGDVVVVHSSFDQFEGFTGKPLDVIRTLRGVVGSAGTILMPTIPFQGTAVEYASRGEVTDLAKTPSGMGLLTELFRRLPGVRRSIHPTHPVAALGPKAEALNARHFQASTPCGRATPFGRLLDCQGKILLLGTGIESMTFFHTIEELLEPQMPFSPFTVDSYTMSTRAADGTTWVTKTRLFHPQISRRRNLQKLVPALKARGVWKQGRVGRLDVILLRADEVLEVCQAMAVRGVFCYD